MVTISFEHNIYSYFCSQISVYSTNGTERAKLNLVDIQRVIYRVNIQRDCHNEHHKTNDSLWFVIQLFIKHSGNYSFGLSLILPI